jgi:hypothetical protein
LGCERKSSICGREIVGWRYSRKEESLVEEVVVGAIKETPKVTVALVEGLK